jgi:anaerobic dimethyl sulfoxide reductase subunit B (iron-sulfur subunit)
MQMAFYFDQSRCIGCYACSVACKDWNNIEAGPAQWRRVTAQEWGAYPEVFLTYVSLSCSHCAQPACADACPVNAITKNGGNGIIAVNQEECLGYDNCGACKKACPYTVPQFGSEENAKMQMCTLCNDRLKENRKPACVDACPVRALDAGPTEELQAKYGKVTEVTGFSYSDKTRPSILFKPRYKLNPNP